MRSNYEILKSVFDYHEHRGVSAAMDEARKEAAIEFCLHIVGQLKCNPENKTSYDENSNESFIIMLPATIHKRYELFLKSINLGNI